MNEVVKYLERYIADIRIWMLRNRLKMNVSETEMIVFSSPVWNCQVLMQQWVGNLYDLLTNLEIFVWPWMCIRFHIFPLKSIQTIQNVPLSEALGKLVHASVTGHHDYCNSNLIGVQDVSIQKLQLLQNSAVCLVSKTNRHAHITLYLMPRIGFQ